MQWHKFGLIASWEFLEEYVERKSATEEQKFNKTMSENCEKRKWGVMVIIKSLQFFPNIVGAALKEATHNFHKILPKGSTEPIDDYGNMMHIALVGINNQMSLLQDRYKI